MSIPGQTPLGQPCAHSWNGEKCTSCGTYKADVISALFAQGPFKDVVFVVDRSPGPTPEIKRASNSQGGSDNATPQETQGWRGLHNRGWHTPVEGEPLQALCNCRSGNEPLVIACPCTELRLCWCCLTSEVEALREENLRLKAGRAIERLMLVHTVALLRPLAKEVEAWRRKALKAGEPYTRPVTQKAAP
jgi:hypothetical protein